MEEFEDAWFWHYQEKPGKFLRKSLSYVKSLRLKRIKAVQEWA
jgi:hypothetical protein